MAFKKKPAEKHAAKPAAAKPAAVAKQAVAFPDEPIGGPRETIGGLKRRIAISFSYLYPAGYRKLIDDLMKFTDLAFETNVYIGAGVIYGLAASAFLAVILSVILGYEQRTAALLFAGLFIFSQMATYGIIFLSADRKAAFSEEMLPDALQLASAHIRSGITPDKALMMAARPEFGSLEREIKLVAREAMTGTPLDQALLGIGKRVRSSLLEKTMTLVAEGIRSGGELAVLLEETAEDIRNAATLRREVKANVMMYIILIFMASAIGAPVLFGTTTFLVESVTKMGTFAPEKSAGQTFTNAPVKFAKANISVDFMINFAIATIITSGIFGGLTLGLIEAGREKEGLKYIPVMVIVGLLLFFISRSMLSGVFSSLFI